MWWLPAAVPPVDVEQHLVVELGATAVGSQCPGQDGQQSGLPGTVGPEDGQPFLGLQVQVDVEATDVDLRGDGECHRFVVS